MSRPSRDPAPRASVPTLDERAARPGHLAEMLAEIVGHPEKAITLPLDTATCLLALAGAAREVLRARVTALQTSADLGRGVSDIADLVLDVAEAARRLNVSTDYVYRHKDEWPFTVRNGRNLGF